MNLALRKYTKQIKDWPNLGKHILAQFTEEFVTVYQAYKPSIGNFADKNKYFEGTDFSFNRMSWIKPNFLWMMYRNGWGQKDSQEVTLAVKLKREAFDIILKQAVHSSFVENIYGSHEAWRDAVQNSEVRLQWDPDHDPYGGKVDRRAIQLGLRGDTLKKYSKEWIVDIEDISNFVASQREHVLNKRLDLLEVPLEEVYPVTDKYTYEKLGIDSF